MVKRVHNDTLKTDSNWVFVWVKLGLDLHVHSHFNEYIYLDKVKVSCKTVNYHSNFCISTTLPGSWCTGTLPTSLSIRLSLDASTESPSSLTSSS